MTIEQAKITAVQNGAPEVLVGTANIEQVTNPYADFQGENDVYESDSNETLIHPLDSTSAIAREYLDADPHFQIKTQNLVETHPSWRRIKGDGSCGWRAVAFGYFETLLRLASVEKIKTEIARLTSLHALLRLVTEDWTIEEFSEEVLGLLKKLITWLPTSNAEDLLVEAFNEPGCSGYIVYYFRLLASAQMAGFLDEGVTIEAYYKDMLVVDREIDDLGNSALYDIALKPARMGLEILYLNRSVSETIDVQLRIEPGVGEAEIVRLLYRPGHYDIIYKKGFTPPPRLLVPRRLSLSAIVESADH